MRKVITMIAVAVVAGSASADLTIWQNHGGKLFDIDDIQITSTTGVTAWSVPGDITGLIIGGTIDDAALAGAIPAYIFGFGPPWVGGTYEATFSGDGSLVGTRTDFFQIGNYIGIIGVNSILDLQPDVDPPSGKQNFSTGDAFANITIIPEPSSAILIACVGGLGVFARRRFQIV